MTKLKMKFTYPQQQRHPLSARDERRAMKIKSISTSQWLEFTTATNRDKVMSWKKNIFNTFT